MSRHFAVRPEDAGNLRALCSPAAPSPYPGTVPGFFGTPVLLDPEVLPGILREVSKYGTADHPLTEASLRTLLAPA